MLRYTVTSLVPGFPGADLVFESPVMGLGPRSAWVDLYSGSSGPSQVPATTVVGLLSGSLLLSPLLEYDESLVIGVSLEAVARWVNLVLG